MSPRADVPGACNLEAEWTAMRRRHAKECQDFIFAHQADCAEFFRLQAAPQTLMAKLSSDTEEWLRENCEVISDAARARLLNCSQQFGELSLRAEVPKMKSRLVKSVKVKDSAESEILSAEAR